MNTNKQILLGALILIAGLMLFSYSISSYKEVKSLSEKIDFEELDNNSQMATTEKYFKYLSNADYLNQYLNKNKNIIMKNTSCSYLDYAQHNAISLYKLTYNGIQTEESRKAVAAGNIRNLIKIMDNYGTCKQTSLYKAELNNILNEIQKSDDLYAQRTNRMETFMNGYDNTYAIKGSQPVSEDVQPELQPIPPENVNTMSEIPSKQDSYQENTYSQQVNNGDIEQYSNYSQNSVR